MCEEFAAALDTGRLRSESRRKKTRSEFGRESSASRMTPINHISESISGIFIRGEEEVTGISVGVSSMLG
jgi:hypothetical protein